MVPALGGLLDPRSESGMTVLIRFPIGVGYDNCVVGDDGCALVGDDGCAGVRVVFGLLILIELNG